MQRLLQTFLKLKKQVRKQEKQKEGEREGGRREEGVREGCMVREGDRQEKERLNIKFFLKKLCISNDTNKKVKGQLMTQRKYMQNICISAKRLASRIYKEHLQINNRKENISVAK